jgi:hypothetical protein
MRAGTLANLLVPTESDQLPEFTIQWLNQTGTLKKLLKADILLDILL